MDEVKRKAIEKAVVELGGEFDTYSFCSHVGTDYLYVYDDGEYANLAKNMKASHLEFICTRDEFEQVKEEMQSKEKPMKYEYDAEYECNGVKPDLPDDVEVDVFYTMSPVGWQKSECLHVDWPNVSRLRIVDERYKPKSNWHERGELSPVGEVVEVAPPIHNNGDKVRVICHDENNAICRYVSGDSFGSVAEFCVGELRPLRTERDELVEKALSDLPYSASGSSRADIEALIDAGWRPTEGATDV